MELTTSLPLSPPASSSAETVASESSFSSAMCLSGFWTGREMHEVPPASPQGEAEAEASAGSGSFLRLDLPCLLEVPAERFLFFRNLQESFVPEFDSRLQCYNTKWHDDPRLGGHKKH